MADSYQRFTSTTAVELWSRIDASAARFLEVARQIPADAHLAKSSWTARDVIAHLVTVLRRYTRGPTLGDTPRDVDRINAAELDQLAGIAADQLLDDLALEMKTLRHLWSPERLDLTAR